MSGTVTRSKDEVWLVGHPCDQITGARLPSGRDVLLNFMYFHRAQNLDIHHSAILTYDQLVPFWMKVRLPVRAKQHIIKKIENLNKEHAGLMKNRKRSNKNDVENQEEFSTKLDLLFDISHADSDTLITIEEDKQFLKLQQQERVGCFGSLDKNLADKEKRAMERKLKEKGRAAAAAADKEMRASASYLTNFTEASASLDDDDDDHGAGDPVYEQEQHSRSPAHKRQRSVVSCNSFINT